MGYFWSGQVGGERRGFFSLHLIQYIMIIPAHCTVCSRRVEPKTQHHYGDGTRIPVSFARWLGGGGGGGGGNYGS